MILWDVRDPARPQRIGPPLTGHTERRGLGGVRPGRAHLGHGSNFADGLDTVILWDVTGPDPAAAASGNRLTGHTDSCGRWRSPRTGTPWPPAGHDGTVILWDVRDPARPQRIGQPLTGHTDSVSSVAFAPDGHTLATGSGDHTVILWDVRDPARPQRDRATADRPHRP